jgi:hypothetical protein
MTGKSIIELYCGSTGTMPGNLGMFSGFWAIYGNFGRFLGMCGTFLAFSTFHLDGFGKLVGIIGYHWASSERNRVNLGK